MFEVNVKNVMKEREGEEEEDYQLGFGVLIKCVVSKKQTECLKKKKTWADVSFF